MARTNQPNKIQSLKDAAQNSIKASGINPNEALALRLRDAKKQAEAGSEQHQQTIRVLAKKLTELQPKQVLGRSGQSGNDKGPAGAEKEAARAMVAPATATPTAATPKAKPVSEDKKRKVTVMTRSPDKRQEKKVKARVERTKQGVEKTPSVKATGRQPRKTAPEKDPKSKGKETTPSKTGIISADDTEKYTLLSKLPDWYTSISMDSLAMKQISKRRPAALAELDSLKALVQQCERAGPKKPLTDLYDKLRDAVHRAEITFTITPEILRKANMLSPQAGLPRIFQPSANFPPDLKADSYQLYKRWSTGDLEQSLLRGIVSTKSHSRNSDSIDKAYRSQFSPSYKYIGHGPLVQGQWWPTQLCALRDGAHGAPQGGICGSPEQGAYSIVLSSGVGYDDTDDGETIYYSGTPGSNGEATENTKYLLISLDTGHPVRVLRSSQLPKGNPYRPQRGLRYDGLYTVVDVKLLDEDKAMHRFRLERCKGQMGIRYQGKGARPTEYEVKEYERLKEEGAWKLSNGES